MKRLISLLMLAILLAYALSGCGEGGPSPTPTPTPTETPEPGPPTPGPRCGDGVCDGPENPQNCPQDCPPRASPTPRGEPPPPPSGTGGEEPPPTPAPSPTPPPTPEPTLPAAEEWAGNVDFTCETVGGGGEYFWRAYIDFEFTVAPSGIITGSGSGEFFDASCALSGCTCEFSTLGPILAQVSGSRAGESFHLSIVPSAEMAATHVCAGHSVTVPLAQLTACASVEGGPTDVTIEARDNAWVEWGGSTQVGIGGSITTGNGVTAVYLNR
jgi:predicted small lipoprotein YifL